MRVYYQSYKAQRYGHRMTVAPAGDKAFVQGEVPAEWVDHEGQPVPIEVVFLPPKAEATVADNLGKYMIERGLAKKAYVAMPNPDDALAFGQAVS